MITQDAQDILFNNARTHSAWLDKKIDIALLHQLYDLVKMAPTSANCSPLRIIFITTDEARQKLKPYLMEGNVDKTMTAPVTAVLATDYHFYDHLPFLFPHTDAKAWFAGNQPLIDATAFRNASLQVGYFIMAARALGLDCGPMSGFDADGVNKTFFPSENVKVNVLCNLGYGDQSKLHTRSPRFSFDQVCKII